MLGQIIRSLSLGLKRRGGGGGLYIRATAGTTLHEEFVQVFGRFSVSSKPSNMWTNNNQFTNQLCLLESENLRKTCTEIKCKVAPVLWSQKLPTL